MSCVCAAVWAITSAAPAYSEVAPPPAFDRSYEEDGDDTDLWPFDLYGDGQSATAGPPQVPYDGPLLERPVLTGDWWGNREFLRDSGYSFDLSSTNFYQGVTSGGLTQEFRYGGRADYYLNIDGEKAGLGEGQFITLHGETLYGRSVNGFTGAVLPISYAQNFPINEPPVTALTGVTFTQFFSESLLVYFGKINTLDDYVRPFRGSALGVDGFMNGGFLFPTVLGRTIPYSTFGGGVVALVDLEPVFSVNVYDTNNTPTVSGFDTFFDNGATIYTEATLPTEFFGLPGHHNFGGAYSSGDYFALDPEPYLILGALLGLPVVLPQETDSWVLIYGFDQALWADGDDPRRTWGFFGSAGISDGNPNPVEWSADIGVGGASLLAGRPLDTFGVGYFYLGVSEDLKQAAAPFVPLQDEHGVEVFYNFGMTRWFQITPDLQVVTPVQSQVDTSLNFGLRAKIDF